MSRPRSNSSSASPKWHEEEGTMLMAEEMGGGEIQTVHASQGRYNVQTTRIQPMSSEPRSPPLVDVSSPARSSWVGSGLYVVSKSGESSFSSPSLSPSSRESQGKHHASNTFALALSLPVVKHPPRRRSVKDVLDGGIASVEIHYAANGIEASPSTASASISTRSKASSFSISTSSLPSSSPFLGSPSRTGGVSPVSPMPSTHVHHQQTAIHSHLTSHAASSTTSTLAVTNSQMYPTSIITRSKVTRHKHKHTLSFDDGVLGKIAAEVTQQSRINREFEDEPAAATTTNAPADDNLPADLAMNATRARQSVSPLHSDAPHSNSHLNVSMDVLTPALASSPRANSGQLNSGPASASSAISGLPPRTPTPTNSSLASTLALSSPIRQGMSKLAPLQSLSRSTSTDCFPSNSSSHGANHSSSNNPPHLNPSLTHAYSESASHSYSASGQQAVSPSNRLKVSGANASFNTNSSGAPRVRRGSASHSLSHSQSLSSNGGMDSSNPLSPTQHLLSISPSAPLSGSASPIIVSPQSGGSYRRSAPSAALPISTSVTNSTGGGGGPQSPLPPMIQRRSYSGNAAVVVEKEKDTMRDRASEIPVDSGPSSNRSSSSLQPFAASIDLHPTTTSPRLTSNANYPAQFTTSPVAVKVVSGGRTRDGGPVPFKELSPRNSGTPGRKNSARSPVVGLPIASFTAQHSHAVQQQQQQQQVSGHTSLPQSVSSSTNTSFNSQITPFSFHHMPSTSTMASNSTAFDSSSHQQSPAFSPRRSGGPLMNIQSPALRSLSTNSVGNEGVNLQAAYDKKKLQNQPARSGSATQAQVFALSAHLLSQHSHGEGITGGSSGLGVGGMGLVPRSRSGSVILPPLAPMSNPATPGPSHAVPPDFDLDVSSSGGPPDTMSMSLPVDFQFKLPPQSFTGTKSVHDPKLERALSVEQREKEQHTSGIVVPEAASPTRVAPHSIASPGLNKRLLPQLHHHHPMTREVPLTELPAGLPVDDRIGFGVLHTGDADRRPMSPPLDLEQLKELENAPTRGSDRSHYDREAQYCDSDEEEGTSMRDNALRNLRSPRPLHIEKHHMPHMGGMTTSSGAGAAGAVFSTGMGGVGRSSVSAAQAALEAMQAVAAATRAPLALHKSVPKLNLNAVNQAATAASALASPLPPDSYRPDKTPPPLKPTIATASVVSRLSMKIQSLDIGNGLGHGLESLGTHAAVDSHLTMTERDFVSFDLDASSESTPAPPTLAPELLGLEQHRDRERGYYAHGQHPQTSYQQSPSSSGNAGSPPTLPPSNVCSASASPDVGLSHNRDSPAAMALDSYSSLDITDAHTSPVMSAPVVAGAKATHSSSSSNVVLKQPRSNIIPADPQRMSHF